MTRRTLEIAAFLAALLVAALAVHAWLASRADQQQLQSTLATQKQLLDAATARETTRNDSLKKALAKIARLKRDVKSPRQILRELPKYLPLPQPITFAPPLAPVPPPVLPSASAAVAADKLEKGTARTAAGSSAAGSRTPKVASSHSSPCPKANPHADGRNLPVKPAARIPTADLKPLYNYVQDCRSCQLRLAAAERDRADDQAKIAALTRERNAAMTAAKGGGFWLRLRRNALWFVVGAAAGYVAAKR